MRFVAPFCFFAFFLSGFSSLVYELTWTRLLKQVFGTDSFAFASILIIFIAGLSLGSFLAAKFISSFFRVDEKNIDKTKSVDLSQSFFLLSFYGLTEFFLAFYSLLVPFILDANNFQDLWVGLANLTLDHKFLAILFKLILGILLFLLPTTLIGFGLPVLSELLVMHSNHKNSHEKLSLTVSNLYGTNTCGAILGTLVTGFILLPKIGLHKTVLLAVSMNLLSTLLVIFVILINRKLFSKTNWLELYRQVLAEAKRISLIIKSNKLTIEKEIKVSKDFELHKRIGFVLTAIAFLIGFINLALEILWNKILVLIIGSSTYSLTIVLSVVFIGLTIGAFCVNFFYVISHKFKIGYFSFLKLLLFLFSFFVSLSFIFLNSLPWLYLTMSKLLHLPSNLLKFIFVASIYLPVVLVEGTIFAFLLFLVTRGDKLEYLNLLEPIGTRVAKINFWNTIGAICGAFLIAFVLMPLFSSLGNGIYYSLFFIVGLSYFVTFLAFFLGEKSLNRKDPFLLLLIFLALMSFVLLRKPIPELFSSGLSVYSDQKFKPKSFLNSRRNFNQEIIFHKEGLNSIITIVKDKIANAILLKSNGKVEAGIPLDYSQPSKADLATQVLLGTFPFVINSQAHSSLVIGMGSGVTVESLARAGSIFSLKQIDVCEIEKVVYEAADKFFVKSYPGKIKINRKTLDARNFLLGNVNSKKKYDIIISQPSDPWISANLFTKEFWSLAASNLNQNGIFVQWLQLYSIDPEYLTITLRTFQSVFIEVLVFKPVNSAELILIGSNEPYKMDEATVKALVYDEITKAELNYIGIENEADLLAPLILVPDAVRSLVSTTEPIAKSIEKENDKQVIKPQLSEENLIINQSEFSNFKIQKLNLIQVTDDNMLLEFHTYNKISAFWATINENVNFITRFASPELLHRFLASDFSNEFLLNLASSHIGANNIEDKRNIETMQAYFSSPHAKLGLGLAEYIHQFTSNPQSFATLIEIYKESPEAYRAKDLAFDALFQLERYFRYNPRTGEPVVKVFQPNTQTLSKDIIQLYSLAKIFQFNKDYSKAKEAINSALKLSDDLKDKYWQSKLYSKRADIDLCIYKSDLLKKDLLVIFLQQKLGHIENDLRKALEYNSLNRRARLLLAKCYLEKSKLANGGKQVFVTKAEEQLLETMKINPNMFEVNLILAEIYMEELPQSQMKFMQAINSVSPDPEISRNLDLAVKYLQNSLELKPYSVIANYYMLKIQNLMGNIDHVNRHMKRLERLCGEDFTTCTGILDVEEFKLLNQVSLKLNSIQGVKK